jgi:gliding motility-associated-like protein
MWNVKVKITTCAILLYLIQFDVFANNILGGSLEVKVVDKTSVKYKINLRLHIDETNGAFPSSDVNVKIFRKSDNSEVESLKLQRKFVEKVYYEREVCIGIVRLNTVFIDFESETTLDQSKYSDPEGYYIVWTDCCRQANIVNVKDPKFHTTTFRTFFFPIFISGSPFYNSTPSIGNLKDLFICKNERFEYRIPSNDSDGDELKFSLVTPIGYHTSSNSHLEWEEGYSTTEVIPGNPALEIDAKTGVLHVNPETAGLFVFAVCVEEHRDGRMIGACIKEYILYVVDCSPSKITDKNVYNSNKPVTELVICKGSTKTVNVKANSGWHYQWVRNGEDIPNATSESLTIDKPGDYWLTFFRSGSCPGTNESKKIHVSSAESVLSLEVLGSLNGCDSSKNVVIRVPQTQGYSHLWYKDDTLLPGKIDSLIVTEPGNYWVVVQSAQCALYSDTVSVRNSFKSPILAAANSKTSLCLGDSILLEVINESEYLYNWYKDDQKLSGEERSRFVKQGGNYKVSVIGRGDCPGESNIITIRVSAEIKVEIDSIFPICGNYPMPITLTGTPSGGIFQGPGVVNGIFNPKEVGPGVYEISYSILSTGACASPIAKTNVKIHDWPKLDLQKQVCVFPGVASEIGTKSSLKVSYNWSPSEGLSDPSSSMPIVTTARDLSYRLTATDSNGCKVIETIEVRICSKVLIPDAFSPNQDGINEIWELRGINYYPDAEVNIFNRWGNLIFHSKGYDKPFDGASHSSGVYYYKIKLDNVLPLQTGALILIR